MKSFVIAIMLLITVAANSGAASNSTVFLGVKVTDCDIPSAAWKAGVVGVRPIVGYVSFNSPAAKYGFNQGDIILSVNDKEVRRSAELNQFTTDVLTVYVLSGSEKKVLTIDRLAAETEKASRANSKTLSVTKVYERNDGSQPLQLDNSQEKKPGIPTQTTTSMPAKHRDVVDELLEVTGCRRDLDDLFGRSGHSEFAQIMSEVYSPELAEKIYKRYLVRNLNRGQLAEVLAWYKSSNGKKLVEAESVVDFSGIYNLEKYTSGGSEPGFKQRMSLVRQIEKGTNASEIEMKMYNHLFSKMIKSIPSDFHDGKAIKDRIKEEIPTFEQVRNKNINRLAYIYRNLTLNELRDYLRFLHSASGKKYTGSVKEATEEILNKVAMRIGKEFMKNVVITLQ